MEEQTRQYLDKYLESLSHSERQRSKTFSSGYFCGDEYNANICSELIAKGIKTATCSLKSEYEKFDEKLPRIGDLHVVTDWLGNPTSIIEVTSVSECQFSDVGEDFAFAEGEGDRSLEWWREAHWDFFTRVCAKIEIEATEDMMLILERFKVVHQ